MTVEFTENADLDFDNKHYEELKRGIVIFPETLEEAESIETLREYIDTMLK